MAKQKQATQTDQEVVKDLQQRLSHRRWMVERNWWGNILFFMGQQWVMYDQNNRRWKQRRLSPSVPTPVTNYFRSTLDTVKSAIAQHEPRYVGIPTRDDARAVAAAAATDSQLKIVLKEGQFDRSRAKMLDWLLLSGNAFQEIIWDNSEETGMEAIPHELCVDCQTDYKADQIIPEAPYCPKCGGQLIESADKFDWTPRGEIRFDTLSPFQVFLDPSIEELEDQPFILIGQSFTQEQIKMRWDVQIEGGFVNGGEANTSLMHQDAIAAVTPGVSMATTSAGSDPNAKRTIVWRAFIKMHEKYPKGAYIAMTSQGVLLEKKTEYPWKTRAGKGRKFYPLTHYKFGTIGGRAWGYTPADDLLPKQYQLNKAESLMSQIVSRMANPVWLIPANTNPSRISGDIGVQIEYTPVGSQAPSRVPGAEAPQTLVHYIKDIRESFEELSGAFAAVKGKSMGSRTPVGTVQALQERGFGRWSTVFSSIELGYQDIAKKAMEVWRQNAHSPRIVAIKNAIGGFTFQEFMGADWDDGVEVEVEAGSSRPHTQAEKMTQYAEFAQMGVLDFMDEAQKIKMLEDLGMVNMRPGVEEDTKHAYKENAVFLDWARQAGEQLAAMQDPQMQQMMAMELAAQMPVHVVPIVDDHAVHFLTHRRLALTEEFKSLPMPVQEAWYAHMQQHQADLMLSQAIKGMMSPQKPGEPGDGKPGAGPGGGSPDQASTKEMNGGESGGGDAPGSK